MPSPDGTLPMVLVLIAGLGVFTLAMWWDRSDRVRQTRRSDVAFWIHLLAAPMIAHPIFHLLGVTDGGNIGRSEEHTSELQSLMRTSYAVFCLKKKIQSTI